MRIKDSPDVLINEVKLQRRVAELGKEISKDYEDKDLLLVCILKGGFVFLADLIRQISIEHDIDFIQAASYGVEKVSTGVVNIFEKLGPVYARDILIIEDIIETGYTLEKAAGVLRNMKPATLKICTLLNKVESRRTDIQLDYTGFIIPDELFVFGYGLDSNEQFRHLPFIGCIP